MTAFTPCPNRRPRRRHEWYDPALRRDCPGVSDLTHWRSLRGPALTEAMLAARWHAQPNDVNGGWCVMPVDEPPSAGFPEVAQVMSRAVAEHIAELHNRGE